MNKIFTDKELKQIKSIKLLCSEINDYCYQLMDKLKQIEKMHLLSPHDVYKHLESINGLREYIKENVGDKYTLPG